MSYVVISAALKSGSSVATYKEIEGKEISTLHPNWPISDFIRRFAGWKFFIHEFNIIRGLASLLRIILSQDWSPWGFLIQGITIFVLMERRHRQPFDHIHLPAFSHAMRNQIECAHELLTPCIVPVGCYRDDRFWPHSWSIFSAV